MKHWSLEEDAQLLAMHEAGISFREIARRLGRSHEAPRKRHLAIKNGTARYSKGRAWQAPDHAPDYWAHARKEDRLFQQAMLASGARQVTIAEPGTDHPRPVRVAAHVQVPGFVYPPVC